MGLRFLGIILLLFVSHVVEAQHKVVPLDRLDSITRAARDTTTENFYERIKQKTSKSRISRFFYNSLIIDPCDMLIDSLERSNNKASASSHLVKEKDCFLKYAGAPIANIIIYPLDIFECDSVSATGYRHLLNSLHKATRENVIKRNLMFKKGQKLVPGVMTNNEVFLRSLPYISEANIMIDKIPDTDSVNVYVITRDNLSLSIDIKARGARKMFVELYDDNIFGFGNRLAVRTYLWTQKPIYAGNQVQFDMPNILGTFINLSTVAGKGFDERRYGVALTKPFLLTHDFAMGLQFEYNKDNYTYITKDTSHLVSRRFTNVWIGKSFSRGTLGERGLYIAARYQNMVNPDRPQVALDLNTYFHNEKMALLSMGIYRENYYQGRFIYGYGRNEDIAYGYRFDLTSGYTWGEFGYNTYIGGSASGGGRTNIGYIRGLLAYGTQFRANTMSRTTFIAQFNWFSRLLATGNNSFIRQFVDMDLTMGFNRKEGEGERVGFYGNILPRGISKVNISGRNRLVFNTETVIFSPFLFYGFRFAFFAFGDCAWIGDRDALFCNDIYSTVGFGVRLKNEKLIFKTIELRFGLGINKNGLYKNEYVRLSQEPRYFRTDYKPTEPQYLIYK